MAPRAERFTVHSYEADAFGDLTLPALAGYLQDIAGRNAEDLGFGLAALHARGVTWVLARQRLETSRRLRLGEELTVETWPSGVRGLVASREFRVSAAGEVVAVATTAWLVLDLATRRPVRPEDVLDPALRPDLPSLAPVAGRLPRPGPAARERPLEVRYADIDLNQHVTNTSYLGWALETAPEELWRTARAASAEIHFLAEARLGEAVVARGELDAEGIMAHEVVRSPDGTLLARLRTRWERR